MKYEGKQYMKHVPIVVLDFGSQYTQIIARKLREAGAKVSVIEYPILRRKYFNPKGFIEYIVKYRKYSQLV